MTADARVLNFVSDIPTPHINELLSALKASGGRLNVWYAAERYEGHGFRRDYSHVVERATIFGTSLPSLRVITHALRRPQEQWLVVGWSNSTTRVLVPLFALLGRPYGFYMDLPDPAAQGGAARRVLRSFYLAMLRRSATMFAVGRTAADHLVEVGFPRSRVTNLPIPVAVPGGLQSMRAGRGDVRARYGVPDGTLFLVSGSRLTHAKGYDVPMQALARLAPDERARVRLLLIGTGPERPRLEAMASSLDLQETIRFENWLEADEFIAALAAADVVLHPARFDAYGAATLIAVGVGVPVVASRGAGAALEMIQDGVNGFLYDAEDAAALCQHIRFFLEQPNACRSMGAAHRGVAERLSPSRLAHSLLDALPSR